MISELPTVAIERVFVYQNTGVIQDENLAQRLGLVPIAVDPNHVNWPGLQEDSLLNSGGGGGGQPAESSGVEQVQESGVSIATGWMPHEVTFGLLVEPVTERTTIYSGDLKWLPGAGETHAAPDQAGA